MSLGAARLLGSLAISASTGAAALALVAVDPPLSRLEAVPSLLASVGAACLLFLLLSRRVLWLTRVPRRRLGPLAVRGAYLTITSAGEEVLWRWLVLGGLAPVVGLASAFLASTVGFALSHGVRRRDVFAVHLVTGAAFGAVYAGTGQIEAAILAHALYNWLVVAAIESGSSAAALPATVGAEPTAVLDGVGKRYGKVEALRGFSLAVHAGEVLALLGPNGAGKTTALSILLGLRAPDEGTARLFGRDPHDVSAARGRDAAGDRFPDHPEGQ